uniref:protein-tyrosine-phosphatase n=1 Tax=Amphilophus citrinellus TaxID=61819 RepID=A0A3Q0QSK9_AMPCI
MKDRYKTILPSQFLSRSSHLSRKAVDVFLHFYNSVFFLRSERRHVRHYWFTSWPDHHIPQCIAPYLKLVEEVETYSESLVPTSSQEVPASGPGPIIVHCSAGIGRTGCFIASSIGCQQLRETGQADVLETVCQLRLDRGGMIQTTEQYQFLYSTLAQYSSQLAGSPEQHQEKRTASSAIY